MRLGARACAVFFGPNSWRSQIPADSPGILPPNGKSQERVLGGKAKRNERLECIGSESNIRMNIRYPGQGNIMRSTSHYVGDEWEAPTCGSPNFVGSQAGVLGAGWPTLVTHRLGAGTWPQPFLPKNGR